MRYCGISCLAGYRLVTARRMSATWAALLALGIATVGLGLLGATVASDVDLRVFRHGSVARRARGAARAMGVDNRKLLHLLPWPFLRHQSLLEVFADDWARLAECTLRRDASPHRVHGRRGAGFHHW